MKSHLSKHLRIYRVFKYAYIYVIYILSYIMTFIRVLYVFRLCSNTCLLLSMCICMWHLSLNCNWDTDTVPFDDDPHVNISKWDPSLLKVKQEVIRRDCACTVWHAYSCCSSRHQKNRCWRFSWSTSSNVLSYLNAQPLWSAYIRRSSELRRITFLLFWMNV